jgi:hypothetical protein
MKSPPGRKQPLILTPRDEQILKALHTYQSSPQHSLH